MVIVSAVVIAVVATLVLRFTSLGLATRMTVDHPRNAGIAGVNTEAVTAGSWMVGVDARRVRRRAPARPIVGLQEFQFTLLLVGSFAAVVIGRMTSLPLAFVGAHRRRAAPADLGQVPARRAASSRRACRRASRSS